MIRDSKAENSLSTQNVDIFFEAYNRVLKIIPDYWLIYALKATVFLSLIEIVRYDDELLTTLDTLFQLQDSSERKEAYFIFPYICYAGYIYFVKQDRKKVLEILTNAEKSVPEATIQFPVLSRYLFAPFKEFMKHLKNVKDPEIEGKVRQLAKTYFSGEKALKSTN